MPAGEKNGRWKGGEWTNSRGYVMVLVGKDHPMASCRAYAKRCRLVCYETHGMPEPGQHAHHINGDKSDDRGENLRWEWPTEHGQLHLTPERARKIGAKGGRATARKRRREDGKKRHRRRSNGIAA
ncbi:MAG TPA: HNH endonuclease [Gemmatimonadaceae bacterium]|jgi:hypothetical protein